MNPGAVDAAYQIRAGNLILDGLELVRTDVFSFTAAGTEWVNQQWGAAVILAGVHRLGGWQALHVFKALLLGLSFFLLYRACLADTLDRRRAAWLTIGAACVAIPNFALRAHLFGVVLFSLVLFLVTQYRRRPSVLWTVPFITLLWANLHGTFFLAPALLGLACLHDLADAERRKRGIRVGLIALTSVAAALVNPYGADVYDYIISVGSNPVVTRLVSEWAAPDLHEPVGIIFFASILLVSGILARRGREVSWPHLTAFAFFFVVGLTAVRNTIWWALGGAATLAPLLARIPTGSEAADTDPKLLGNTAIAAMLVALIVLFLPWGESTAGFVSQAPVRLTSWVEDRLQPGERIFNAQIYGSWLVLALEDNPVFVDTRIELYPSSVWRDYLRISAGRQGWQDSLDRWQVDFVVADRNQQKHLLPLLEDDPGWRLLYEDADGLVFGRAES